MSVWILLLEALSVGGVVAFINHYYGDWHKQHIGVTIASFLSWYLPLLIVCVLPIDISVTFYNRCMEKLVQNTSTQAVSLSSPSITSHLNATNHNIVGSSYVQECREPWIYIDPIMMFYFWRVVYWTSQFLTWMLLPMMQSFAKAGNFTVLGKLKAALLDNVIYYGTYLIIFSVIFTYVVFRGDINLSPDNLKVTVISAANTWGLFLVIIFLGYGLVEVPRVVLHAADPELSLRQAYFQLSKASMEKAEYEEELEDCLKDVQNYEKSITPSHYLRDKMTIIVQKSEEVIPERWNEIQGRIPAVPVDKVLTEKDLIYLHRRLKLCQQRYTRTQALWQAAVHSALWLEAVENNRGSRLRQFRHNSAANDEDPNAAPATTTSSLICNPTVEWYWNCFWRPIFLKALAYSLICISVAVVWSECTFFVKSPPLSIYAAILQAAARNYNFLTISLISFVTIGYLCFATYYTVFHLRIFNYFQLVGNHLSDENSMIFCGMLLCRLTPPLCLNFLGLVHMDSHVMREENGTHVESSQTSYTRIMGHLNVIPFISRGFNVYFPMVVLVLCLATLLRLGTRCLHAMGLEQFLSSSDEFTQDAVEEGRVLLRREKLVTSRRNATRRGPNVPGSSYLKSASSGTETRALPRGDTEEATDTDITDPASYQSTDSRTALNSGSRYTRNNDTSDDRVQLLAAEEIGDDLFQPSRPSMPDNSSTRNTENNLLDWTPVEYNADAIDQYLDSSINSAARSGTARNTSTRTSQVNDRPGFRNLFN